MIQPNLEEPQAFQAQQKWLGNVSFRENYREACQKLAIVNPDTQGPDAASKLEFKGVAIPLALEDVHPGATLRLVKK